MPEASYDPRRMRGLAVLDRLFGGEPASSPVNADLMAISTAHLFGDIWTRPALGLRDRELVTLSVIAALGFERQLRLHLRGALAAGLGREEIVEAFIHLAHYSGYPSAFTALAVAQDVFAAIDADSAVVDAGGRS
ncbi:MAG: carboxymuconolactone decarboxylase family protein [Hyphomonadaceae bacterium]|nr:carboxymuconolactone decarboxylase family protein [Hyphomonadaceae bacterium]